MMNRFVTAESIVSTIDLARALDPLYLAFLADAPIPGTVLHIAPELPVEASQILAELLRVRVMFDADIHVAWTIGGERSPVVTVGASVLGMLFAAMHAPDEDQRVSSIMLALAPVNAA